MKQETIQKLYMFGIMAGVVLIMAGSVYLFAREPSFNGQQIITKEYQVGGERVIVNEQPPVENKIFGADVAVFKPEVKLEKWGDETFIKVWLDEAGDDFATEVDGKVVWKNKDKSKEVNLYPTTFEGNEAFEYEIILKSKPKSNVISLKIETQGLEFYYQPELTQEEIDEGAFRPENVIGSYAVYHSTQQGDYSQMGGKNYRAGKAFHIYRPLIIDSIGKEIWGKLNIDVEKKLLTVEIPQEFLDKAVYPVRHAAGLTFGKTAEGASTAGTGANKWTGTLYASAADTALGVSMSIFGHGDGATANVKLFMFVHTGASSESIITNGVTPAANLPADTSAWRTATFSTSPSLDASTDYVLAWVQEDANALVNYDNGATANVCHNSGTEITGGYAAPTGCTNIGHCGLVNRREHSIYCTYTAAAAEAPPINQTNIIIWSD